MKIPKIIAFDLSSTIMGVAATFRPPEVFNLTRAKVSLGWRDPKIDGHRIWHSVIAISPNPETRRLELIPMCPKGSIPGHRFHAFRDILKRLLAAGVDLVLYEYNFFVRGKIQAEYNWGMVAHLEEYCFAKGFGYDGIQQQTLKSFIFGKNHQGKRDAVAAMQAAQRRFSVTIRNDHEAHAMALIQYWREQWEKRGQ